MGSDSAFSASIVFNILCSTALASAGAPLNCKYASLSFAQIIRDEWG